MRPLLILACSATKRAEPDSAYELYDGPAYRVLRASGWPNVDRGPNCRVMVLSAEHGLVGAYAFLHPYDRRMDEERAAEFAEADEERLREQLFCPVTSRRHSFEHFPTSEVYVWGGALYRSVVHAWEARGIFGEIPVTYSSGGIGRQLAQLKGWLNDRRRPLRASA